MRKTFLMKVSLCFEFKAPKKTKVKADKRSHAGRLIKVRSYYRKLRGLR